MSRLSFQLPLPDRANTGRKTQMEERLVRFLDEAYGTARSSR